MEWSTAIPFGKIQAMGPGHFIRMDPSKLSMKMRSQRINWSKDGVVNLLAFGPSLVENGEITVDTNSEVGQSMASNPRTAIGIIDENHYIIVVSDGRTSEVKDCPLPISGSDEVLWR